MDVQVENNQMTIEMITHEYDRYNFDIGKQDVKTGTPDDENGRFASAGWANSFITEGTVERKIKIDLLENLNGVNMQSSNVKVETEEMSKRIPPWEGDN